MHRLLRLFDYQHLPQHLQQPSRRCAELARILDGMLPDSPEKTAGLRHLLEAKDCFVRAQTEAANARNN